MKGKYISVLKFAGYKSPVDETIFLNKEEVQGIIPESELKEIQLIKYHNQIFVLQPVKLSVDCK